LVTKTEEHPLKEKLVGILKPNECALIYDEKRGKLLAVCNKNGKIEVTFEKEL
jgi:hypothetical protein